uniref:Uracil phosphoribosyltransferase or UMP pyrophosphorylase n=1 Tax=Calliarthron tuberculosum TaxID=48942 RepID=M4IU34_CALTB|nr:uracil phosphoribosyltransferase or UMP pyrophosphorylase [Calliarthron tuberculosum]AGA63778.1 uracil phosphoribosyltransferase or UMP pyrophosphorylase [Calliarthron tuberculosum]
MKLNIHVLSHPIIQHLSSLTKEKNLPSNIKNYRLRQLGLFLLYETIRNWIKTYRLTIRKINKKKNITIIDPEESYTIITNTNGDLSLIQELQCLIPKCNINLIPIKILNSIDITNLNQITENIDSYTKIIIVSNSIDIQYISKLMLYLTNIKNLKIEQIRLTSINCKTDYLIEISKTYPTLHIYTTEINRNDKA